MVNTNDISESAIKKNERYHRGQLIIYRGEDAQVIDVKPVFTIRIKGKSHVICGNIFNDVKPSVS